MNTLTIKKISNTRYRLDKKTYSGKLVSSIEGDLNLVMQTLLDENDGYQLEVLIIDEQNFQSLGEVIH